MSSDAVNHPAHYTQHPSGVECITITRHMGFNTGSAMKYLWRADLKADAIEDLNKAAWYLHDEIVKRGGTPEFVPRATSPVPVGVQPDCKCPHECCADEGPHYHVGDHTVPAEQRTPDCLYRERTGEHDWLSLAPGITGCRVCGKRKP